jgi:hypothetical protein
MIMEHMLSSADLFEMRICFYAVPTDEQLDNDCRLLAPVSPFTPLWDDVQAVWLRDWQVA